MYFSIPFSLYPLISRGGAIFVNVPNTETENGLKLNNGQEQNGGRPPTADRRRPAAGRRPPTAADLRGAPRFELPAAREHGPFPALPVPSGLGRPAFSAQSVTRVGV